jgi:hypothetical protein
MINEKLLGLVRAYERRTGLRTNCSPAELAAMRGVTVPGLCRGQLGRRFEALFGYLRAHAVALAPGAVAITAIHEAGRRAGYRFAFSDHESAEEFASLVAGCER